MTLDHQTIEGRPGQTLSLVDAPHGVVLRIVCLSGGEDARRRLMALGFHAGDLVELDGQAILRGPILVRNRRSGTTVALGRSVARKVSVEPVHERP